MRGSSGRQAVGGDLAGRRRRATIHPVVDEASEVGPGGWRWARPLVGASWVIAVGLTTLLAMWLFRIGESTQLGWILSSAVHLALLCAWIPLLVAVGARARALGAVAVVLLAAQLAITWPLLPWSGSTSGGQATLRLRSTNAFVSNDDPTAYARRILADPRDVITISEFTPQVQAALEAAGIDERYPHHRARADRGTVGMAVYSRFPIGQRPSTAGELLAAEVRPPGAKPVLVFAVHAFPPAGADPGGWARALRALDRRLRATDGPWVAIGDFNATSDHRRYRDLLDGGRSDAHLATGRGLARSWPASSSLLPPLFLIDRAIVPRGVEVLRTAEHTVPGSDHRVLDVDIEVDRSRR